jgi:circadian clock protein KaiC
VVVLEQTTAQYGAERRRLRVAKLRGSAFRSGFHDYAVHPGGLVVFPRLIASEHRTELVAETISSGISQLDTILGGGIDRSTCTLVMGPAGVGKSVIVTQFAVAAALRGDTSSVFLFEERIGTWLKRGENLGMPLSRLVAEGKLKVTQVDPAELAPDEFTHLVRQTVEKDGAKVIVIDSVTGYYNAMPEARFLSLQMHELLSYLAERGVATLMTMAQTGSIGAHMVAAVDISYLADAVVVMRYYETQGCVNKAIAVLKKRSGSHETSIRSLALGGDGIQVGDRLSNLKGIFSGVPIEVNEQGDRAGT